jgi:hypothetical protein
MPTHSSSKVDAGYAAPCRRRIAVVSFELTALTVSTLLYVLLYGFDLGVEMLFVALATRRDGTRYLSAVNLLPRNPSQEEFGVCRKLAAAGVRWVYGISATV